MRCFDEEKTILQNHLIVQQMIQIDSLNIHAQKANRLVGMVCWLILSCCGKESQYRHMPTYEMYNFSTFLKGKYIQLIFSVIKTRCI